MGNKCSRSRGPGRGGQTVVVDVGRRETPCLFCKSEGDLGVSHGYSSCSRLFMSGKTMSSHHEGIDSESVVVDFGRRQSPCPFHESYGKLEISHGLTAHSLSVTDYQELLERGWIRSGNYLFQLEMETTCCPAYALRLKADKFTPSKEHRRVVRRMERYLNGTWDGKKQKVEHFQNFAEDDELYTSSDTESSESKLNHLSEQIHIAIQSLIKNGDLKFDMQYPNALVKKVSPTRRRQIMEESKDLLYTSSVSFQIYTILRKAVSNSNGSSADILSPNTIAENLASVLQHLAKSFDFSVKASNGHINFYSDTKTPENPQVESQVGNTIPEKPRIGRRELHITYTRARFDVEEFALYRKYQIKVHNNDPDQVTENVYQKCLVETPLIYVPPKSDGSSPSCGFGSFHQQYRINGRLAAVGMIDILPKYLSSNYFFWDPELDFLSLGKYSALLEIDLVKRFQRHCRSLQYYCLGSYSHSCPKMRYKTTFRPSELLCPRRYKWVPYDLAKPMLNRNQYIVLSDYVHTQDTQLYLTQEETSINDGDEKMTDPDSVSSVNTLFPEDGDHVANADIGDVLLGLKKTRIRFKKLRRSDSTVDKEKLKEQLLTYKKVVGKQLSERMVYSLI